MAPSIRTEFRSNGVALLTIDQPGSKVNVLTEQLWSDLETAIDLLASRGDAKGLVIASAKPGVFIAGADLKLLANADGPNDPAVKAFIEHGLRVLEKLESLPFPTCAAIDGAALGGGLEVALACDCRALGTHAKVQLGLPEVKLGLIPGWGGTQRLPRIVEESHASTWLDMLTTGESLGAEAAFEIDLATMTVADPSELIDFAANFDRYAGQREGIRREREEKLRGLPFIPSELYPRAEALSGAAAEAARVAFEGSSLPLYDAIKLETAAFLHLAGSPQSKRRIDEFFASRRK